MRTGGPKVLIVDDDADVARAFARILTHAGYGTAVANNGRDALRHIEEDAFDVVVSDVSMPEMGGVELLTEVFRRDPELPVILITGGLPLGNTLTLLECRPCQCLTKPIMPDELVRAVLRAAGSQNLELLHRESSDLFADRPNRPAPTRQPAGGFAQRSRVRRLISREARPARFLSRRGTHLRTIGAQRLALVRDPAPREKRGSGDSEM
jgi:DNA-binding NtrC family response regulator